MAKRQHDQWTDFLKESAKKLAADPFYNQRLDIKNEMKRRSKQAMDLYTIDIPTKIHPSIKLRVPQHLQGKQHQSGSIIDVPADDEEEEEEEENYTTPPEQEEELHDRSPILPRVTKTVMFEALKSTRQTTIVTSKAFKRQLQPSLEYISIRPSLSKPHDKAWSTCKVCNHQNRRAYIDHPNFRVDETTVDPLNNCAALILQPDNGKIYMDSCVTTLEITKCLHYTRMSHLTMQNTSIRVNCHYIYFSLNIEKFGPLHMAFHQALLIRKLQDIFIKHEIHVTPLELALSVYDPENNSIMFLPLSRYVLHPEILLAGRKCHKMIIEARVIRFRQWTAKITSLWRQNIRFVPPAKPSLQAEKQHQRPQHSPALQHESYHVQHHSTGPKPLMQVDTQTDYGYEEEDSVSPGDQRYSVATRNLKLRETPGDYYQ
jgi:hypothetical protein